MDIDRSAGHARASSRASKRASAVSVTGTRRREALGAAGAGPAAGAPGLWRYGLSDALARFRRTYPAVKVSAIEDSGEYLEHLLIGGENDVAFLITSNLHNRAALQVETIAVSAMRLWLPLGHPLVSRDAITLDEVAEEPLIMLSVEEIEESTSRLISTLGARPNVAFRTRSVEAVRSLVATGMGLAILPDLVYRPWSLEGDRIEIRDVSGDLPSVSVGLAWRRGAPLGDVARDFVRLAQSSFRASG
jgi:DNA-binding transcriptional LysR family regulator